MTQHQASANTFLLSLVILTTGVLGIGIDNSVIAQDEIRSDATTPTPPAPTVAVSPATTPEGGRTGRVAENELGYQPLLQGPVHEAFASHQDASSMVNPRFYAEEPPADVREQAPEDPSGENMLWIPGYWSWDDQTDKYVWVSGVYRKAPPGRTWVPGHWSKHDRGHRWTSGFWAGKLAAADDQVYLPMPPQSIDNGPSVPPPREDCFWLPGSWEYGDGGYRWRSGYWTRHYEGWVWQPACYMNTPQGFVYNSGYWDCLPPDRGTLFAPIDFYRPVYLNPQFVYRPRFPLANSAALLLNIFARRGYSGFYYGNFYGPSYAALGYQPWFDMGYGSGGFGNGRGLIWLDYYDWNYGRQGIDFRGSMGRYQNFYGNAGRGGPSSVRFDGDPAPLAGNANSVRGSRATGQSSFDEVVLRDFNGQSPPRADRKPQGTSFQHKGGFDGAGSKVGSDTNRGSNRDFDRGSPTPRGSNSFGGPSPGGGQSMGGGNSRGGSPSFGGGNSGGGGQSFGGGNSGKGGGGNSGKGGGGNRGGGGGGKGGGKK